MSDPITTPDQPYGNKRCRCAICGVVEFATISFDFYPYETDGQKLLQCERCLLKAAFGTAYPPIITLHPDGTLEEDN